MGRRWKSPKRQAWYREREVAVRKLGFPDYEGYTASGLWKDRRERWYREHSDAACFVCLKREKLVLHHCTYVRIGKEPDADLIPLCSEHHSSAHFLVVRNRASLQGAHLLVARRYEEIQRAADEAMENLSPSP
jgi:hypothetical protein